VASAKAGKDALSSSLNTILVMEGLRVGHYSAGLGP
jgi:hypothetical protein